MNTLTAVLRERVAEAVSAVSYPSPAGGSKVPSVFVGGLPLEKKQQGVNGDESHAPYIIIRVKEGVDDLSERVLQASFLCCVWSEDVEQGIYDINDLTLTILSLQRNRGFTPYKLVLPAKWTSGDEQGGQPHPFYFSNIVLQFKGHPLADRKI